MFSIMDMGIVTAFLSTMFFIIVALVWLAIRMRQLEVIKLKKNDQIEIIISRKDVETVLLSLLENNNGDKLKAYSNIYKELGESEVEKIRSSIFIKTTLGDINDTYYPNNN